MIIKIGKFKIVAIEAGDDMIALCSWCGGKLDDSTLVYSLETGFGYCSRVCSRMEVRHVNG